MNREGPLCGGGGRWGVTWCSEAVLEAEGSASRKLLQCSLCYSVSAQDYFPGIKGTAMEDTMRLQHLSARVLLPLLLSLALVATQTSSPVPAPLTRPCSFYTGKTCEECLKNVSCLWCLTNSTCLEYPVRSILPPSSLCAMSAARWGACWINFEALIITMGVVAGILVLSIIVCCCYCCYCRKSSSSRLRLEAEEENLIREREKRKQESLQRKSERTVKHNEIRKKYGLLQDTDHPYSKFDNE